MSFHGSEGSDNGVETHDDEQMTAKIAAKETRAVNCLRIAAAGVLVLVAALVCSLVFFSFRSTEDETFETEFSFLAGRIIDSIALNAQERLSVLESFSTTVTSFAIATGASFPFVTIPDFEIRASYAQKISHTIALLTLYVVDDEDRDKWENYTSANSDWIAEGLYHQAEGDQEKTAEVTEMAQNGTLNISPVVFAYNANGTDVEKAPRDIQTM